MKNRKKRAQREEVRKILHTMRLELAAQRVAQEADIKKSSPVALGELLSRAQRLPS